VSKRGKMVEFHGAFATKAKAKKKERQTPGAYVERVTMKRYGVRYLVLTRK
jgi:hypothetical protein